MTRTELPWLLAGRLVRPFPLAASIACAIMAVNIATGSSVWGGSEDVLSAITAGMAVLSAISLWVGWWGRSSVWMQHGLMLCAVVFSMRSATIWMQGNYLTAALSACWVLAAGGAWLLERTTADDDIPGRGRYE